MECVIEDTTSNIRGQSRNKAANALSVSIYKVCHFVIGENQINGPITITMAPGMYVLVTILKLFVVFRLRYRGFGSTVFFFL